MNDFQPIETAPKDGVYLWLDYGDGALTIGKWVGFWRPEVVIEAGGKGEVVYLPLSRMAGEDGPREPIAWMALPRSPPSFEDASVYERVIRDPGSLAP